MYKRQEQIKNYETEIAGLKKEIGQANENLRNRQNAYHREYSRLESLRNLTERYDGYGNSIRRVMEQKSREPKILGVVADLIKVDKKYETAVEIALGGSIQNIVTACLLYKSTKSPLIRITAASAPVF